MLGTWTGIKTGLKALVATITTLNGYNYDWPQFNKNNIEHFEDIYVTVHTPDGEENTDKDNYVGSGRFDNTRVIKFYLYLKNPNNPDELDDIVEDTRDNLELGLDDFNNRFNGTIPDELCSQGVYAFDYSSMKWEDLTTTEAKTDMYAPVKMLISYTCKYRKNRNIS